MSSDSGSDSDSGNVITASNYGVKRSIAALSARQVLAAVEEKRRLEEELGSDDDLSMSEDEAPASKGKGAKKVGTMPAFKKSLVSSDDEEEEEEEAAPAKSKGKGKGVKGEDALPINAAFAAKFDAEKRAQTLSKKGSRGDALSTLLREAVDEASDLDADDDELLANAKAILRQRQQAAQSGSKGSDGEDDESGSSEDEDADLLTEDLNAKIAETLRAIKEKKPEVYDSKRAFFTEEEMEARKQRVKAEKAKKAPTQTVTQLLAQQLLGKDGKKRKAGSDADASASSADESDEDGPVTSRGRLQEMAGNRPATLTYSEQQQKIKEDFLRSAAEAEAAEKKPKKGKQSKAKQESSSSSEDEESDEEVFKVKAKPAGSSDTTTAAAAAAPAAPEAPDDFLNSYLSNEWWREKDLSKLPTYKSIKGEDLPEDVSASEDEAALDETDAYEEAYNFRFQEPNAAYQIKSYPRTIDDSLRKQDSKRKTARETAKAHKAAEALKKKEEIARLKAAKRKEISAKLGELEEITGLKDTGAKLDIKSLLHAWDPAKHDEMMAKLFSEEEFYADEADANMDEEQLRALVLKGEDLEAMGYGKVPGEGGEGSKKKKGKKKGGKVLDPAAAEQFEAASIAVKKGVHELQQLDFEDLVGPGKSGAPPPRFRYREVKPDTYGLSLSEILEKPDAELNSKVSLKKLATYREDADEPEYLMPHQRRREEKAAKYQSKAERKEAWMKAHPSASAAAAANAGFAPSTQGRSDSRKKQQHGQQTRKPTPAAPASSAAAAAAAAPAPAAAVPKPRPAAPAASAPASAAATPRPRAAAPAAAAAPGGQMSASQKRRMRKKKLDEAAGGDQQGAAKKQKVEAE